MNDDPILATLLKVLYLRAVISCDELSKLTKLLEIVLLAINANYYNVKQFN
jgi:hypothetical protein